MATTTMLMMTTVTTITATAIMAASPMILQRRDHGAAAASGHARTERRVARLGRLWPACLPDPAVLAGRGRFRHRLVLLPDQPQGSGRDQVQPVWREQGA
ncbi:hypothetical protein G6F23_014703 [Rhizopus arrhizus]|nr:hypothetical protein G6F23_014703 [Rhizopus arrhizus]